MQTFSDVFRRFQTVSDNHQTFADTSAEQVIVGLLRCGPAEVSRDSRVIEQLADAVDTLEEIRPAVAWRGGDTGR